MKEADVVQESLTSLYVSSASLVLPFFICQSIIWFQLTVLAAILLDSRTSANALSPSS